MPTLLRYPSNAGSSSSFCSPINAGTISSPSEASSRSPRLNCDCTPDGFACIDSLCFLSDSSSALAICGSLRRLRIVSSLRCFAAFACSRAARSCSARCPASAFPVPSADVLSGGGFCAASLAATLKPLSLSSSLRLGVPASSSSLEKPRMPLSDADFTRTTVAICRDGAVLRRTSIMRIQPLLALAPAVTLAQLPLRPMTSTGCCFMSRPTGFASAVGRSSRSIARGT